MELRSAQTFIHVLIQDSPMLYSTTVLLQELLETKGQVTELFFATERKKKSPPVEWPGDAISSSSCRTPDPQGLRRWFPPKDDARKTGSA